MRTTTLVATGVIIAELMVSNAAHADANIRLRAGAGPGEYSVSSDIPVGGGHLVDYKASYLTIPIGVTLIMDDGMYVDLLHQKSSGDAKFAWSGEKPSFSRDDTTLTIGTRKGNFSVYLGYKVGETRTSWPTGFDPDKLTASGFLAGLGWAKTFSSSAITLGAGVGVMNGEYSYAAGTQPLQSDTTLGFSLGAGYTYLFSSSFSVTADLKWQSYNYNLGAYYLKENPTNLTLSLQYTF